MVPPARRRPCSSRKTALAAAAALLAAGLLTAPAPAADLVLNGSIEQYHGLGRPFAWTFHKSAAAIVNTDRARSRTGDNSLEFDLSRADGPEWDSRRYAVRPGRMYRARFYYHTEQAISRGELFTFVRWWADDSWNDWQGQALLSDGVGTQATPGWVKVDRVVTAPAGARYGEFHLWGVDSARGPVGRVFLDDFSLRPLPEPGGDAHLRPADGAEGVSVYTTLEWGAGPTAEGYDLYLGESYEAVLGADRDSPEFLLAVPVHGDRVRHAVSLQPYTQYFWRADPVTAGSAEPGGVWSFSTAFDLLEDIAGATAVRYAAHDSAGRGLDTLQVVERIPGGSYIGVYHTLVGGEFEVRLATSTDLLQWTYRGTLAANADMPALEPLAGTDGYLLAHEQWENPGSTGASHLRFRYYPSYTRLLSGSDSRDFTAPLTQSAQNASNLEGTPSFFEILSGGNRIRAGFHFFDADTGGVDRNATGTLRGFLSGQPSWSTVRWKALGDALVAEEIGGNIGDRDAGDLFGRQLVVVEGQYTRGDFGAWREWFWDTKRARVFPLHLRTRRGSSAFGNMTWRLLTSPAGRRAIFGACFLFSEGAATGESGEVVYYNELPSEAWGPSPASGASGVALGRRLHWLAAAGASGHDVYFGTDAEAVARAGPSSAEYGGQVDESVFSPGLLQADTVYYWRVDETFAEEAFSGRVFRGPLWSFRTGGTVFRRGDCNDDGEADISDALCILNGLFAGAPAPGCLAAADANGDGVVDISDAVSLLGFLFTGGLPPPPPFPDCGLAAPGAGNSPGCGAPPASCS